MALGYHNLAQIGLKVGTFLFSEFAADGLSWEPVNDQIVTEAGARGSVVMSEMFDSVSELTVTIMPQSPNNSIIDQILGQTLPLTVTDLNSDREIFSNTARIKARPPIGLPMQLEGAPRVIVFTLVNDTTIYGSGNLPPP